MAYATSSCPRDDLAGISQESGRADRSERAGLRTYNTFVFDEDILQSENWATCFCEGAIVTAVARMPEKSLVIAVDNSEVGP